MFHTKRRWRVDPVGNAAELAEKLTESTWCLCQGFEILGYLFLNDATSPDGAQEYAIVKRDKNRFIQVESITFDWCAPERALQIIDDAIYGEYDDSELTQELSLSGKLDSPAEHGTCRHCA